MIPSAAIANCCKAPPLNMSNKPMNELAGSVFSLNVVKYSDKARALTPGHGMFARARQITIIPAVNRIRFLSSFTRKALKNAENIGPHFRAPPKKAPLWCHNSERSLQDGG